MGHDERRRLRENASQPGLDPGLRVDVERRERVVEHQHRGTRRDRTREREPLPLAAGEAQPFLAHASLHAIRKLGDEVGLRDLERLGEHLIGDLPAARELGAPEQHVLADGRREQRRVLEGHRDVAPQLLATEIANVDAVEPHRAAGHVVQPGRERRQRRLARIR